MYTISKNDLYIYQTYRGDYIFMPITNMLFVTESAAYNWLQNNFIGFDSNDAIVVEYPRDKFVRYQYSDYLLKEKV